MTLPEQSDRAVRQTREFLLRLASPYGEHGIKGIRQEVRAEALALLRHYPCWYQRSDEDRGNRDMSGANVPSQCTLNTAKLECETSVSIGLVTRLRNWRSAHLARLHILMDEAADAMERLSQKCDCPEPDNRAIEDKLGRKLAHPAADTLTDAEREALEFFGAMQWPSQSQQIKARAATLRTLLERLR